MIFDKAYYDGLWPECGVHRHDYCEDRASWLIAKYGMARVLDIGTGCGFFIKCLRERGCDAWGLDISDYAIQESCLPEFVRKGDVLDIPFASKRFDVVHSQGVWEYIPEQDVHKAFQECQRVGRLQEHNIDFVGAGLGEENFVTAKSPEWWHNRFYPKILVGCPNHIVKEYAFQRWIDNVKTFTYPNVEILVIDNSPSAELKDKYGDQIPILDARNTDQFHHDLRITQAMAILQKHFLAGDYERWFNCESDIIPPKDVIEKLLQYGQDSDWISHAYPLRNGINDDDIQQGIGCSLLSRRLMETFDFIHAGDNAPDGWLWAQVRPDSRFTTMEMWNYFKVQHLRGPGGDEWTAALRAKDALIVS